jgi:DNA-binding SARP family transcriptional activator
MGTGHQVWEPEESAITLYWLGTAHLALGEAHQAESGLLEALRVAESSVGLSILAGVAAEDGRLVRYGLQIGVAPANLALVERLAARRRPWTRKPKNSAERVPDRAELPRWEARLFGSFILHRDGQLVDLGVKRDRARELLALLLLHPDGLPTRTIADLLWPDMTPERSMHNLRMTVYLLRVMLGSKACVRHAALAYRLEPGLAVWADVQAFDAALSRSRQVSGELVIRGLEQALGLYRGPLLAGTGWQWLEPYRGAYETRATEAMLRLAQLVAPADLARSDALAEQALAVESGCQAAYDQLVRNARARRDPAAVHDLTQRYEAMLEKQRLELSPRIPQVI